MERLVPAASELSVAEQAELTAGVDLWHTAGVDRLGLAGIGASDGPSGSARLAVHGVDLDAVAMRHRPGVDVEP